MYKILFWALMFIFYVALFWGAPLGMQNPNSYLLNVLACHIVIGSILIFAFLVGFLHDKAFN